MQSYIAFIDLLGTRDLAQSDPDDYFDRFTNFRDTISNHCQVLADIGKIYFFSDCAYITSNDLQLLLQYVQKVRASLLIDGNYFKGAISKGDLSAKDINDNDLLSKNIRAKRNKILKGTCFGKDVISVYAMHERLKGIGIYLDSSVVEKVLPAQIINSCFLPHNNSIHPESFVDIKYSENELHDDIVKKLIERFFKAKAKTKNVGRYYVPIIISMIQSYDLGRIKFGKQVSWDNETLPFIMRYIGSGTFEKHFSDVVGTEYIYFSVIRKLYSDNWPQLMIDKILKFVLGKKRLKNKLEYVPRELLATEIKNKIYENILYLSNPNKITK